MADSIESTSPIYDDSISADEISGFSRPLLTFAAVMTIIIMIVGIFGNILTTVALLKCPKVRNVAAAFIISLCIADCIFCAAVLPFSAFRFIQGTWTHGDFLCKLIPFIQYGNIGVSLLCIAMITINRYVMIAHHSAYAKIYKRHWIGAMIVFCWVFSYGMQLPTFFGVWGEFGFDHKLGTCSILRDQFGRSSKTALFAIAFVTPCIIIIACYARIFWVVHESEVRMRRHAHKQNTIPNNLRQIPITGTTSSGGNNNNNNNNGIDIAGNNVRISTGTGPPQISTSSFETSGGGGDMKNTKTIPSGSQKSMRVKDQRDAKAKRNEWRITKMVLAIFLSFVACYLPITIVKVVDQNVAWPGFHIFAYIMLYLSSCINPIIYVIMNKQYRQAYKAVLKCNASRLLAFTNAGSSAGEKWKDIGYSYNHSRTMVSQVSLADQQNSIINVNHQQHQNHHPIMVELTNTNLTKSHLQHHNNNNNNSTLISNNPTNTIANITNNNRRNWLMNPNNNDINNTFQNSLLNQQNQQSITINNNLPSMNTPITTTTTTISPMTTPTTTISSIPIYHPLNRLPQQQISAQLELPPQQLRQSIQRQDIQRPGIRITLNEDDIIIEEEEEPQQILKMSSPITTMEEESYLMTPPLTTKTTTPTTRIVDPIFTVMEAIRPNIEKEITLNSVKKSNDIPDDNNTKAINNNNNNNNLIVKDDSNNNIGSIRF